MNITRPFLSRFSRCLRLLARSLASLSLSPPAYTDAPRAHSREQNGGGGTKRDEAAAEMDEEFRSHCARFVTSLAFVYMLSKVLMTKKKMQLAFIEYIRIE